MSKAVCISRAWESYASGPERHERKEWVNPDHVVLVTPGKGPYRSHLTLSNSLVLENVIGTPEEIVQLLWPDNF